MPPPMWISALLLRWQRLIASPVPEALSQYADGPSASARALLELDDPAQRPASPEM